MRISDREYNRLRVLRTLRRCEPIGRTDLAELSHLDGATITEISRTLLARGLIVEERAATGKRGRPQRHLRLNPEGAFALGAYVSAAGVLACEIVNLRGDPLYQSARPLGRVETLRGFTGAVASLLGEMIDGSGFARASISRVGIALPAVVDSEGGFVHWMQTLDPGPYPTAAHVSDVLGIPVSIDNNIDVLARAEHWFGQGTELDDFSIFNFGHGLTAAHYANGSLRTGRNGLNSEFGHAKIVAEDGLPCECGAHGCLNAYSSIGAIVRQACAATGRPMPEPAAFDDALGDFIRLAREGHGEVTRILDRAIGYLAVAIANSINILDPGRVIVLCEHPDLPALVRPFVDSIRANCLPPMRRLTSIEIRPFDQERFRMGAAALVLERLYATL